MSEPTDRIANESGPRKFAPPEGLPTTWLEVTGMSDRTPKRPATTPDRFWAKVDKDGPTHRIDLGPCWQWTGAITRSTGYGWFGYGWNPQTRTTSHRYSYELLVGPVPEGLELDHLCRNRGCCNPRHLEPVSHRENQRRGNSPSGINSRKTHCIRGHEFTPENIYRNPSMPNARQCRACMVIHRRNRAARLREAARGDRDRRAA